MQISAYNAGIMQYTLRNIPQNLDHALRQVAQEQGKSLNRAAIEALGQGLGLNGRAEKRRDLSQLSGAWVEDPEIDEVLAEQRRVDLGAWE